MYLSPRGAAFALASAAALTAPAAAQAIDHDSHAAWSARVTIHLDAAKLGLRAGRRARRWRWPARAVPPPGWA